MFRPGGRRLLVAGCAALAVGLAAPSVASAAELYQGQTAQGRNVGVLVADDALVETAEILWLAKDCTRPRSKFRGATSFGRPFDESTPTSFASAGTYKAKQGRRIKSKIKVQIRGQHPSPAEWTGTFKAKVKVTKKGRVIDRCKLGAITWSAQLTSAARAGGSHPDAVAATGAGRYR